MNKNVLKKVCKKLTVILMVAMLLVTSIPSAFAGVGQASPRAGSVTITSEGQLEPHFPDKKFRGKVFDAVRDGNDNAVGVDIKDALRNFTGTISARDKGITNITGLDLLRQAEEIDLRKNEITDFSQLGRNKGTEEEFKTWFGVADGTNRSEGENVHIRIGGNPIEKIPTDFGGKIVIEQPGSTAYTYDDSKSPHFTYLRPEDGSNLSGTINIGKAVVKDHGKETPAKIISTAWNSHGNKDASKFKVDSFTNTTAKFSGLKKSGTGYIAVGVDEEIHYQTADEYGTITPGSQSFKYYLSPKFTIYDKLTVKSVNEGNVVLTKTEEGATNAPVAGAEYSLYKVDGTLLKSGLKTDSNGKLSVIGLATGNYYFKETKAPVGYALNPDQVLFEITTGTSIASKKATLDGGTQTFTPTGGAAVTASEDERFIAPSSSDITLTSTDTPHSIHVTYSKLEVGGIEEEQVTRIFTSLGAAQTDINSEKNANHILGAVSVEADFSDRTAPTVSAITTDKKVETIDIHGTKTWVDHVDYFGPVPNIELTLLDGTNKVIGNDGNPIKTTIADMLAHGKYTYSFYDLPKFRADGTTLIPYTVKEELLSVPGSTTVNPDGYVTTYAGTHNEKITNTYNSNEKTSVHGTKTWNDNNATNNRPSAIVLTLYKLNADGDWKVVTDASNNPVTPTLTQNSGNVWPYEFKDLPKYDGTAKIEYKVDEAAVNNYITTITPKENDPYTFDITNSLARSKDLGTSLSGEKKWVGDSESNRPVALTIQLYRKENSKDVLVKEAIVNKANGWKYEFQGVPMYDASGAEYKYSVKEKNVPTNYTQSYSGFDVINTYTPPAPGGNTETTLVVGTKVWKDYNNALNTRPDTLTVSLYQNDILLTSEVIREVTGWHYRFDNLPKYDASGKEYVYTVKENQVPAGHKAEISKDGTTITNTLNKEANELIFLNIQKKWIGDSKSKDRPKSITVKVYRNDSSTPIKTIQLSNMNKWAARIKNLPKFDDNGEPFKYTVSEVKVDGYRSTQITRQVPTTDVYNVIITNTKVKPGGSDVPSDNPSDPNDPDNPGGNPSTGPKTGDSSPLGLLGLLIILASGGLAAMVYKREAK